MLHDRLSAMVPRSDRNALDVKDRSDVMRMDAFNDERKHRRLVLRRSNNTHTRNKRKLFCCVLNEPVFV